MARTKNHMTKKHYIKIAKMFAENYSSLTNSQTKTGYRLAIRVFSEFASEDNPRFDKLRFLTAAYNITKP